MCSYVPMTLEFSLISHTHRSLTYEHIHRQNCLEDCGVKLAVQKLDYKTCEWWQCVYCKHVSISIGTNCVVPITYGTYNHGVPYHEAKYTNVAVANKSTARVDCLTSLHLQRTHCCQLSMFNIAKQPCDQPPTLLHATCCTMLSTSWL